MSAKKLHELGNSYKNDHTFVKKIFSQIATIVKIISSKLIHVYGTADSASSYADLYVCRQCTLQLPPSQPHKLQVLNPRPHRQTISTEGGGHLGAFYKPTINSYGKTGSS